YMLGIAFGPLAKSLAGNQDLREQLAARSSAERVAEAERTWRLFHPHATKAQIALDHAYDKLRIGSQEWARVMRMHDYQIIERAAHYGITNAHRFPFLMVTVLFGITALIALVLAPGRMKSPPELEPDDDASAVL